MAPTSNFFSMTLHIWPLTCSPSNVMFPTLTICLSHHFMLGKIGTIYLSVVLQPLLPSSPSNGVEVSSLGSLPWLLLSPSWARCPWEHAPLILCTYRWQMCITRYCNHLLTRPSPLLGHELVVIYLSSQPWCLAHSAHPIHIMDWNEGKITICYEFLLRVIPNLKLIRFNKILIHS